MTAAVLAAGFTTQAAAQYSQSGSYANPDPTTTQVYQTSRKVCADPWVTIALGRVFGEGFDPIHCDVRNFNNGQWSDFNQLVHAAGRYKADIDSQRLNFYAAVIGGQSKVVVASQGTARFLANPSDFNLTDQGRGRMVAAGGGNMVAAGGGNMVAAGGGNMVAAGGGNVTVGLPPANVTNRAQMSGNSLRLGSRVIARR